MIFNKNYQIFTSSKIKDNHIVAGSTTKGIGDSRIDGHIFSLFKNLHIEHLPIIRPRQTHSVNIEVVRRVESVGRVIRVEAVDGLVTKERNIILTVQTADCVPIIFADQKNGVVGVSHQGWKGTYGRLAQKMVEKMCELGGEKDEIIAVIGPAIGSCCYEIFGERLEMFESEFKSYCHLAERGHVNSGQSSCFIITRFFDKLRMTKPTYFLNIPYLNYLQLQEIGIPKDNIEYSNFCTKCDEAKFFSYQRDTKETFGEMMHFIVQT